MKKCWICQQELELNTDNFYKNKSKPDGWGTECKTCHKKRSQERRSDRRRSFVASRNNKCEQCSLYNTNYMFFDIDHIEPLHNTKMGRYIRDFDKQNLQVLCPNCHRIKTIKDMKWGKYEEA